MDPVIEAEELQYSVEKLQQNSALLTQRFLSSCKESSVLKEKNARMVSELDSVKSQLHNERMSAVQERKEKEMLKEELEAMKKSEMDTNRVIASLQASKDMMVANEKKNSEALRSQIAELQSRDEAKSKDLLSCKEHAEALTQKIEEQKKAESDKERHLTTQVSELQQQLNANQCLKETNTRLAARNATLEQELHEAISNDGGRKLSGSSEAYELVELRKSRDRLLKEIGILRENCKRESEETVRRMYRDGADVYFVVLEAAMRGESLRTLPEAAAKCFECGMAYGVSAEMVNGKCAYCRMLCCAASHAKREKERERQLLEEREECVRKMKREQCVELRKRDAIIAGIILFAAIVTAIYLSTE